MEIFWRFSEDFLRRWRRLDWTSWRRVHYVRPAGSWHGNLPPRRGHPGDSATLAMRLAGRDGMDSSSVSGERRVEDDVCFRGL
jgi:hypothetical protein